MNSKRVQPKPRPWIWKDEQRNETPGIALWHPKKGLIGHYTPTEARSLADRIHDLCDANGDPEPALPSTTAEQE